MADIVSSLFGVSVPSADEAEMLSRKQNYDFGSLIGQAQINPWGDPRANEQFVNQQAAQAALGGAAVRGLAGLFGVQDKNLKRVTDLESILQETQQELGYNANNPALLYPTLQQKLANAGFSREAMQVGQVGQKAIQEAGLNQAKILQEQAQTRKYEADAIKALREQQPDIVRLQQAKQQALSMGDIETANVIQSQIDKNTYIAEKNVSPQNKAEAVKLNQFVKDFGEEKGSTMFLEWKNELEQRKAAVQGTGQVLSNTGKPIGEYNDKGGFKTSKGEIIPPDQMRDLRASQDSTAALLNIMTTIDNKDIDTAFGKWDVTQNPALQALSSPDLVGAQSKINALGVREVLQNLQSLKGASSDKEMTRVASTFPGYTASPIVMKQWLARALTASLDFTNKNADKYGFDAPKVDLEELANNPILNSLSEVDRSNVFDKLAKYDPNFNTLSEKDKIKKLNEYVGKKTGKAILRRGKVKSGPNAGKTVIEYSDGTREYK